MSSAVVPVKSLAGSKSRLLSPLSREQVEALCLAMLDDVLSALLATPSLERVVVATPDDRVAALARQLGAEALHGPDAGLNPAIDAAGEQVATGPDEPFLVVLGDVAGATADDLERLFEALSELRGEQRGPAAVLAPSSDGGTAALLRAPRDAIASRFGAGSAARHREAAKAAGVPLRELRLASLSIDLDRAEDVERFLASDAIGGRATRRLLEREGWGRGVGGRG